MMSRSTRSIYRCYDGVYKLLAFSKTAKNAHCPSRLGHCVRCLSNDLSADLDDAGTNVNPLGTAGLWEEYKTKKDYLNAQPLPPARDPKAIYANNELSLDDIDVYGFDYDYTLACYSDSLHDLIYNMGKQSLVSQQRYPSAILTLDFNPKFAVRGLHCDVKKGFLLKIDAFHNIQMGTVYRGLEPVPDSEVYECYNGSHVPIDDMSSFYGKGPKMHQLMDLFALSEMSLFSNVIQYFISHDIAYDPEYVFHDVKTAVQGLHMNGTLHTAILDNMGKYVIRQQAIKDMLHTLVAAGKQLFLITNSGVKFVDEGMAYLVGDDWAQLFDVIITNARKPKFFYETARPFRSFNPDLGLKSWTKVDSFKKGYFYQEGNFYKLSHMTGWYGSRVLYFGDHVYTDLADATLKHGWRTGAIIPELEDEICTINSDVFKKSIRWLCGLESLIDKLQVYNDSETQAVLSDWLKERDQLRLVTKTVFNPQFGSLFRTYHNPTYFTRRLNRFADIYMSSITSLANYSLKHTFYPRRTALPHELHDTAISNYPTEASSK